MKKLSLKKLDFTSRELLQKEQLKTIFGGYGGYGNGPCTGKILDHKYLYSGGQVVSEACLWECSPSNRWGGCPLLW